MGSTTDSSVDRLAACATVQNYSDISLITIPGFETLSESKQRAVMKKTERELSTGPTTDALLARLRSITPPLDDDEEITESRQLEAEARKDLERDNCPPCYPSYLDIPLRDPPAEYRPIIEYWKSFSGTGYVVLCAQRSDWRKFRESQSNARQRFRNTPFNEYVNQVRGRRRRHRLGADVHLNPELKLQTPQQNWIEFQDYQLKRLEGFEEKREGLKKELGDAQKKVHGSGTTACKNAVWDAWAIQQQLENVKCEVKRHRVFLGWIEKHRLTIFANHPRPIGKEDEDDDVPPKAYCRTSRGQRRPRTSPVFGPVRVSKPTPEKREVQIQKPKTLASQTAVQDSNWIPRTQSNMPQPQEQETRSRRPKELTSLSERRPQSVSKTKEFAHACAKSWLGVQHHGAGQWPNRLRPNNGLDPLPEIVQTRSGRISRPPARWMAF